MTGGPRRLRDDPAFFDATGVDLAAESEVLMAHDLPRLKRRVMGAVARGAAPRLSPTRGGPGLGHLVAVLAVGGAIVGALTAERGDRPTTVAQAARPHIALHYLAPTNDTVVALHKDLTGLAIAKHELREAPLAAPSEVAVEPPAPEPTPAPPAPRRAPRARIAAAPAPAPTAAAETDAEEVSEVAAESPETAAPESRDDAPEVDLEAADVRGAPLDKDFLGALAETLRRKTFK